VSEQFLNGTSAQYRPLKLHRNQAYTIGLRTIAVLKSIRRIKVKLQETIKPNISNKSKNILGVGRVEQFMQRRNVEVSLSYHVIVVTLEEHMSHC